MGGKRKPRFERRGSKTLIGYVPDFIRNQLRDPGKPPLRPTARKEWGKYQGKNG